MGKKNRNDIRQSVCVKNGLAVSISLFFILGEALCIAFHDIFPGADGVEQAIIGGYAKIDRINDCICVRIKKYGYGIARYSIPVFFDPHTDTVIDPVDLGISADNSLFDPVRTGEYIMERNTKSFAQYKK